MAYKRDMSSPLAVTPNPGDPEKRMKKRIAKAKLKNELKAVKAKGKNKRKVKKATADAKAAAILKKKKDNRAKRISGVAKSLRTKSVNIKGDRRLRGDNVKTDIRKTKIDNRSTSTTAMGGAGGRATSDSKGGRADAGSSSSPRVSVSQQQQQKKKKKTTVNPSRPRRRASRYN